EVRKLFAENGDKEKAMVVYSERHPEISKEEIKEDFDREEDNRSYSVYEIYCIGGQTVDYGEYSVNGAIRVYFRIHPQTNSADVRVELEWSNKNDADYRERYSLIELFRVLKDRHAATESYARMHDLKADDVRAELDRAIKRLELGN